MLSDLSLLSYSPTHLTHWGLAPGQEMTIFYTIYFTPGPDYLGKEFGENTKIHGNFPFKVGYIISLDPPPIEWKILSQSVFAVLDVSPPL